MVLWEAAVDLSAASKQGIYDQRETARRRSPQ